jgi:hypothetical protein
VDLLQLAVAAVAVLGQAVDLVVLVEMVDQELLLLAIQLLDLLQ